MNCVVIIGDSGVRVDGFIAIDDSCVRHMDDGTAKRSWKVTRVYDVAWMCLCEAECGRTIQKDRQGGDLTLCSHRK